MIKWLCNKIVQWGQDYEKYDGEEAYATQASSNTGRRKGHRAGIVAVSEVANIPKTFRFDVSVGRGGPDGVEDFDRELGKIITMYRMKLK